VNLVDDTPIVPGDARPAFDGAEAARQVLNDAEDDLRNYELHVEPIPSFAGNLGVGAMPGSATGAAGANLSEETTYNEGMGGHRHHESSGLQGTGSDAVPPYPLTEAERTEQQPATTTV
jgi:hypothetical protein